MNTTYLVPDMSCGHCKAKIEKEVNGLPGVQTAEVNVDTKVLSVTSDENLTVDEIVAAVAEAGYTAEQQ
ncbi:heavy-metal-associated domain-containing protein [Enterococcus gallinarum]|uniref:heavy-metal-associated domain-containing protein n=1 Tax=Enterococcus TaxID=1350 RepID=UPI002DBCBD3F|nr:heavy metal-associated domain-containing protein [Enterococcus gallinarum]MEB5970163.1 heavy-metal-associated domain-containing protein [Enterococcus gallinarum]